LAVTEPDLVAHGGGERNGEAVCPPRLGNGRLVAGPVGVAADEDRLPLSATFASPPHSHHNHLLPLHSAATASNEARASLAASRGEGPKANLRGTPLPAGQRRQMYPPAPCDWTMPHTVHCILVETATLFEMNLSDSCVKSLESDSLKRFVAVFEPCCGRSAFEATFQSGRGRLDSEDIFTIWKRRVSQGPLRTGRLSLRQTPATVTCRSRPHIV